MQEPGPRPEIAVGGDGRLAEEEVLHEAGADGGGGDDADGEQDERKDEVLGEAAARCRGDCWLSQVRGKGRNSGCHVGRKVGRLGQGSVILGLDAGVGGTAYYAGRSRKRAARVMRCESAPFGRSVLRAYSSLPGLKRTALPGAMLTSVPGRGLRPTPVYADGR